MTSGFSRFQRGLQLAQNATSAAGQAIAGAAKGKFLRSEDQRLQCLNICRACEHYLPTTGRCAICGCFSALKVRLESWDCPKEKWPKPPH
jgi:hypothetical protein